MYDTTVDHNGEEHLIIPMKLVCGDIVVATGFTIHAFTEFRLTGLIKVHWTWS